MSDSGLFSRFYKAQKALDPSLTMEEVQLQFLDHYAIDWMLISAEAPFPRAALDQAESIVRDQSTGQMSQLRASPVPNRNG
jgi:hypothetical protein